jgi:hypothetical protein
VSHLIETPAASMMRRRKKAESKDSCCLVPPSNYVMLGSILDEISDEEK